MLYHKTGIIPPSCEDQSEKLQGVYLRSKAVAGLI